MRYDLYKETFDFLPQSVRKIYRFCGQGLWTQSALIIKYSIIKYIMTINNSILGKLLLRFREMSMRETDFQYRKFCEDEKITADIPGHDIISRFLYQHGN